MMLSKIHIWFTINGAGTLQCSCCIKSSEVLLTQSAHYCFAYTGSDICVLPLVSCIKENDMGAFPWHPCHKFS